jgi:hypothetical protein
MEGFLSEQLEEGEIMWYIDLWDNGKQVTTLMPGEGDTKPKRATSEPSDH